MLVGLKVIVTVGRLVVWKVGMLADQRDDELVGRWVDKSVVSMDERLAVEKVVRLVVRWVVYWADYWELRWVVLTVGP